MKQNINSLTLFSLIPLTLSRTRSRTLSPSLRGGDGEDVYYDAGGMSKGGASGSEPDI